MEELKIETLVYMFRKVLCDLHKARYAKGQKTDWIDDLMSFSDKFNERNAEWHYLQAVIFYKKNWNNESKKQLEIAMQMDSNNPKYKNSYAKLNERIKTESNKTFTSYTTGDGQRYEQHEEPRQMGGDDVFNGAVKWQYVI